MMVIQGTAVRKKIRMMRVLYALFSIHVSLNRVILAELQCIPDRAHTCSRRKLMVFQPAHTCDSTSKPR